MLLIGSFQTQPAGGQTDRQNPGQGKPTLETTVLPADSRSEKVTLGRGSIEDECGKMKPVSEPDRTRPSEKYARFFLFVGLVCLVVGVGVTACPLGCY